MARPATIPAAVLIEDLDFWPRATIDSSHVRGMADALLSGVQLPPVIAERSTKRLVDGWHRRRATLRALGDDAEIEVFWRDYENDAAMFAEAVALNAAHGRKLTPYDHTRIKVRAEELKIPTKQIAVMIHRDEEYVTERLMIAKRPGNGGSVALKRPLRRLAGEVLTPAQVQANEGSSGMTPLFYAHQLLALIRAEVVDLTEESLETLSELRDAIDAMV